jgi:hypothetical protein
MARRTRRETKSTSAGAERPQGQPDAGGGNADGEAVDTDATQIPQSAGDELEALTRELEKSLAGKEKTEQSPVVEDDRAAEVTAPPPPEMNATPEDILGVPTNLTETGTEKVPTDEYTDIPTRSAEDVLGVGSGPAPMDEFEERAALAKEVLRATSDQPRKARRKRENADTHPAEADEQSSDEGSQNVEEREEDVRFSEDFVISSRKKRKLFGR